MGPKYRLPGEVFTDVLRTDFRVDSTDRAGHGNVTSPLDDGQRVWTPLKVTAGVGQSGDGAGANRLRIGTLEVGIGAITATIFPCHDRGTTLSATLKVVLEKIPERNGRTGQRNRRI